MLAVLSSLVVAPAASADMQYELTQEIDYIDCTNTSTQNGPGSTLDVRCIGAVMPSVNPGILKSQSVIVTGTYESLIAAQLRVYFSGVWYVLGVDHELTAVGNNWRLDLSGLNYFNDGTYDVVVEVITNSGLLLRDDSTQEIVIYTSEAHKKLDMLDNNRLLANTGYPNSGITIGVLLITMAAVLILKIKRIKH